MSGTDRLLTASRIVARAQLGDEGSDSAAVERLALVILHRVQRPRFVAADGGAR